MTCFLKKKPYYRFFIPLLLLFCLLPLAYFFSDYMDSQGKWVSIATIAVFVLVAGFSPEFGLLASFGSIISILGISLYAGQIERAEQVFLLKYFLSSPAALLWMGLFFLLSFFCHFLFLIKENRQMLSFARTLCRLAVLFGLGGMITRWYESYLMGPDIGHIPVASFFEVILWLVICCGFFFLYFDRRYDLKALGFAIMGLIVLILGALFLDNQASAQIQPLIPALQSSWMKLHVPTSFIGYAGFGIAAACAACLCSRRHFSFLNQRLPEEEVLFRVMYQSTAIGFLFFAIGIITGSLWAAEAWGSYWQWDPKETWALVVWLNYAAWLHYAASKRPVMVLSVWSMVGWGLSLFAFVGVNRWLPGLHSYAN